MSEKQTGPVVSAAPSKVRTWHHLSVERANAVVDEYLGRLADKNQLLGQLGRTWIEFCLQRHGIIKDVRALKFGQSHALWYACLIATRRIREVTSAEHSVSPVLPKTSTTIARFKTRNRDTIVAQYLRQILEEVA